MAQVESYPVSLTVDYPDRLDRFSTLFRLLLVIPILIVAGLVVGALSGADDGSGNNWRYAFATGGLLVLPTVLMILFRRKYPRWWFDWNRELLSFFIRIEAYLSLLTDQYPSTDEEQAVHVQLPYPDVETDLNRWLPLVKWLLAIPHYVVLAFLNIAAFVVIIIAWFAILITGRYPRDLFNFVLGVMRYETRVVAYALLLVTDRYPPFRLGA